MLRCVLQEISSAWSEVIKFYQARVEIHLAHGQNCPLAFCPPPPGIAQSPPAHLTGSLYILLLYLGPIVYTASHQTCGSTALEKRRIGRKELRLRYGNTCVIGSRTHAQTRGGSPIVMAHSVREVRHSPGRGAIRFWYCILSKPNI